MDCSKLRFVYVAFIQMKYHVCCFLTLYVTFNENPSFFLSYILTLPARMDAVQLPAKGMKVAYARPA